MFMFYFFLLFLFGTDVSAVVIKWIFLSSFVSFKCHARREIKCNSQAVLRWLLIVSIVEIDTQQPINLSHNNNDLRMSACVCVYRFIGPFIHFIFIQYVTPRKSKPQTLDLILSRKNHTHTHTQLFKRDER